MQPVTLYQNMNDMYIHFSMLYFQCQFVCFTFIKHSFRVRFFRKKYSQKTTIQGFETDTFTSLSQRLAVEYSLIVLTTKVCRGWY